MSGIIFLILFIIILAIFVLTPIMVERIIYGK